SNPPSAGWRRNSAGRKCKKSPLSRRVRLSTSPTRQRGRHPPLHKPATHSIAPHSARVSALGAGLLTPPLRRPQGSPPTPPSNRMLSMERYRFHSDGALFYVTFSVVDWLPIFVSEAACKIVTESLNFCHRQKGLRINAYVIMPTHMHAIVFPADCARRG